MLVKKTEYSLLRSLNQTDNSYFSNRLLKLTNFTLNVVIRAKNKRQRTMEIFVAVILLIIYVEIKKT